jgi:endonuclease/exonuclease/phosphatase family metal-dependent hydrolase
MGHGKDSAMTPATWQGSSRAPTCVRLLLAALAALLLAITAAAPTLAAGSSSASAACRPARIMTWNLYLGADLRPAFAPQSQQELLSAATRVALEVVATDFPKRAKTIADDVRDARPDLIGVQEAVIWRTQTPSDPTTPATRVRYDFLGILQRELALRGLHYTPVATVTNSDFEVPTLLGFDLRLTDRDLILARSDLPSLQTANPRSGNFEAALAIPNPLVPVTVKRGWVSVDAALEGCPFRFVATHLEGADAAPVQLKQAGELVATGGPAGVLGPMVLVGDFNSRADRTGTATYGGLIDVGFRDSWSQVRTDPGYTCCHDVAALLRDPFDRPDQRIDLILTRGLPNAVAVRRYGLSIAEWLRRGIWPADHIGVVATIPLG